MTVAGLSLAGVAVASPGDAEPAVAHGVYLAHHGTADGTDVPTSTVLVDPVIGRCYDLTAPTGEAAGFSASDNRTDRVALLSPRTCAANAEGAPDDPDAAERDAPADDLVSDHAPFWSVRFTTIP